VYQPLELKPLKTTAVPIAVKKLRQLENDLSLCKF